MSAVLTLFRQFIITFLVLLQLIAPLVHAHAGKQFPAVGVHLPGLEMYDDVYHTETILQAVPAIVDSEALIVGINTGIQQQHAAISLDTEDGKWINQVTVQPHASQLAFSINFSPHAPPFIQPLFNPAHSPRAPPAY